MSHSPARRARATVGDAAGKAARAYVRHSPASLGKRYLYNRFSWRERAFRAPTEFGAVFEGTTSDLILRSIYWFGVWEPNLTHWVTSRIAPGDTFVDVGANVGYYTLLGSHLVGERGRVIAVEASPSIFKRLSHAVRLNNARNVTLFNAAAGPNEGEVEFFVGPPDQLGWSSVVSTWKPQLTREAVVRMETLDRLVPSAERPKVRLVKIDVEGFEKEVIAGARELLRGATNAEFIVEVNPENADVIVDEFAAAGYYPFLLSNTYNPVEYAGTVFGPAVRFERGTSLGQADFIFSRRDAAQL